MPSPWQRLSALGWLHLRTVLLVCTAIALAACATGQQPATGMEGIAKLAAPSGVLKVGLYPGTPTSLIADQVHGPRGVGYDVGMALGQRLGVPADPVVLANNNAVLDAVKAGRVDVVLTHVTADRASDIDFTQPCLAIELGYLLRPGFTAGNIDELDRSGVRIGVTRGSSSDKALTASLKHATVVRAESLAAASAMLAHQQIDAFATNKPTLFQISDGLPGSTVLADRWGVEEMALGIPKGRQAALDALRAFVDSARADGTIARAVARAGLRGAVVAGPAE